MKTLTSKIYESELIKINKEIELIQERFYIKRIREKTEKIINLFNSSTEEIELEENKTYNIIFSTSINFGSFTKTNWAKETDITELKYIKETQHFYIFQTTKIKKENVIGVIL